MGKTSKEYAEVRWTKILEMPKIECACGCGTLIPPMTKNYVPVKYVRGHQAKGNQIAKGKVAHNRIGDKPLTAAERQRRSVEKKRAAIALMPKIPCGCGCGTMIAPITTAFKPAQYAHGHNPSGRKTRFRKGLKPWNKGLSSEFQPNWHGGKPRHDSRRFRNLKPIIRERDNYTCMRCGKTQSELDHKIEIHHLDHDATNHALSNLVCACHPCNMWASFHRDQEFVNPQIAIRVWDKVAS